MRALEPEVANAVWAAVEALIPKREDTHPLGCHRRRISDRICFRGILIRPSNLPVCAGSPSTSTGHYTGSNTVGKGGPWSSSTG